MSKEERKTIESPNWDQLRKLRNGDIILIAGKLDDEWVIMGDFSRVDSVNKRVFVGKDKYFLPDQIKAIKTYSFNHAEAYALMQYYGASGRTTLNMHIWNSRDGVTPFCIGIEVDGHSIELQHVNWQGDRLMIDHVPKVGDYIFRSYTEEEATKLYVRQLEGLRKDLADPERKMEDWIRKTGENIVARGDDYIKEQVKEMVERGEPQLFRVEKDGVY